MPGDSILLSRIIRRLGEAASGSESSLLATTANLYGSRPESDEEAAPPTFDPAAAALFEAVVEAAYLVANADGVFDEVERGAFRQVVCGACGQVVSEHRIEAILKDLEAQLREDGIEKRLTMVARAIATPDHAREVLRVAGLVAQVSEGVSEVERAAMARLASECGLGGEAVDEALRQVARALDD